MAPSLSATRESDYSSYSQISLITRTPVKERPTVFRGVRIKLEEIYAFSLTSTTGSVFIMCLFYEGGRFFGSVKELLTT